MKTQRAPRSRPSGRGAGGPAAGSAGHGAKGLSSERAQRAATAVKKTVGKGRAANTKAGTPRLAWECEQLCTQHTSRGLSS